MNRILALTAALVLTSNAFAKPACPADAQCVETRSFVATITNFRTSKQGKNRVLTATVRFENKTDKPLTIGYVRDSGLALDELGNRYVVPGASAVRSIGEIDGGNFDPKFTLQPGEASDARFELSWEPGKTIAGKTYELDLAIREITALAGDQFRLGQEHSLHFAGLGQAPSTPAAAAAAPAPAAVNTDPCAGSQRCYNAGTFIAEIMQVQPAAPGGRHHTVSLNVRFRNVSDKPVILGYHSGSSTGIDNFGNRYTWGRPGTHDTSFKGIGLVTGRAADPQFTLNPGQSRSATFGITRFNAALPVGNSFSYDTVIDELEIVAGQVVRTVRQNSLSFQNLAGGNYSGSSLAGAMPGVPGIPGDQSAAAQDAASVAGKVIDLFNKARKKD
jgi:hypothetical protein